MRLDAKVMITSPSAYLGNSEINSDGLWRYSQQLQRYMDVTLKQRLQLGGGMDKLPLWRLGLVGRFCAS